MTTQIDPSIFRSVVSDLEHKIAAGHQREQRLIHERDRLQTRIEQRREKIWPVQVRCDGKRGKRCSSVVAFDPAPEEAALAKALLELGWSLESGHVCPRCLSGRSK